MLDRRLLIVTGKGGVGKSAVAAALALRAARHGRRVLAIGMMEGQGLAAHLTAESLEYAPTEVRDGIDAMVIEPAEGLDEYLRIQLHVPRLGPMTRAFRVLAETVPGIRDTVVMGKVLFEVRRGAYDLVVADGPPIGQIGSYLRAPSTIADLVPIGRVREQATWMRDLLRGPATTGLVMVSLAEELPVLETQEALRALGAETLVDVAAVALNRVLEPLGVSDEAVAALPEGPHLEAALLHRQLRTRQREWAAHLDVDVELPYLFGMMTPGEVAARLADEWGVE